MLFSRAQHSLGTSVLRSANCESAGYFFVTCLFVLLINDLTQVWETRLVECPVGLEKIKASKVA